MISQRGKYSVDDELTTLCDGIVGSRYHFIWARARRRPILPILLLSSIASHRCLVRAHEAHILSMAI